MIGREGSQRLTQQYTPDCGEWSVFDQRQKSSQWIKDCSPTSLKPIRGTSASCNKRHKVTKLRNYEITFLKTGIRVKEIVYINIYIYIYYFFEGFFPESKIENVIS